MNITTRAALCLTTLYLGVAAPAAMASKCNTVPSAGPGGLQVYRAHGHTLSVRLEARQSQVDIGPYCVTTETLNGRYVPPVLALKPGDRLNIHLDNDLPAKIKNPIPPATDSNGTNPTPQLVSNTVNLHTHGLIASPHNQRDLAAPPTPDKPLTQGAGDNVYVNVEPGGAFNYHIDIPRYLAPDQFSRHPEGLFWYHPHVHERAQRQVSAGMASAIVLGSPKYSLRTQQAGQYIVDRSLIEKIQEQVLILKDIQLAVDQMPNEAKPQTPARWIGTGGDGFPATPEAGFIPTQCKGPGTMRGPSWCEPAFTLPDGSKQKFAWLFTVNGQMHSKITVPKGRYSLLRIANTSPSVTYVLKLVKPRDPNEAPDADGSRLPADSKVAVGKFRILAIDGTVPGNAIPPANLAAARKRRGAPPLPDPVPVGNGEEGLLLLPASRAEVLVVPDDGVTSMILQTVGFRAGAQNPIGVQGQLADLWPAMDLTTINLNGNNRPPNNLFFQTQTTIPTAAAPRQAEADLPAGCIQPSLEPGQYRQIILDSDDTGFQIGSSIIDPRLTDPVVPGSKIDPPQPMPMMHAGDWSTKPHICVRQGSVETWEVVNKTNEIHNFHLHQSKFALAPSTPSHPSIIDLNHMLDAFPLFDPKTQRSDVTAWHDTFPIPPALQVKIEDPKNPGKQKWDSDKDQPGSVRFIINFAADQQVGRFVFHCHILEHEDKGMMAPIEVLPALNPRNASLSPAQPPGLHQAALDVHHH